jgi:capsular exopolysaccharide synthesis family protein
MSKIALPDLSTKLIGFAEGDIRARPFKLLRTMLGRQLLEGTCNLIGITSATPHAGKSFIASNLAAAMSRLATNNIVLVDLDLQRASVAEIFDLNEGLGVTEYLLGETDRFADIARQVENTNLTLVPALSKSLNSAELLASDRFSALIASLRGFAEGSTIICDLPPLFVSDDAMLAAQHLDGVILVVEQGVTTKKQLEASLALLQPVKLIGTVFNRFAGGIGDPYGYSGSYGSYYA